MKQAMLWSEGDFSAKRTVLTSPPAPLSITWRGGTDTAGRVPARRLRQREFWPRRADAAFAASRTVVADMRHTREYQQFVRFLRDQMWLDQYIRQGWYRLEYISFQNGEPQYRVYRGQVVLRVFDADRLAAVQREVAGYALAAYGFRPGRTYLTRINPLARKYPREGSWREKWAG